MMRAETRRSTLRIVFTALLFGALCTQAFAQKCKVGDVTVDSLELRTGDISMRVLGRILNKCALETGVQVKLVFYGANEKLLAVHDVWPASTNNIPPQGIFPFDIRLPVEAGALRVDAQVIGVTSW